MSRGEQFRIEAGGRVLPRRSALYGAGEDMRRGFAGAVSERRYDGPAIGLVEAGTFTYRTEAGEAVAVPGTILFGNAGEGFGCAHLNAAGNRRAAVVFTPDLLAEAAAEAGSASPRFAVAALAPGPRSLQMQAAIRRLVRSDRARDDVLIDLLAAVFGLPAVATRRGSARETRRILDSARHLDRHFAEPHGLDDLAVAAGISRFHFVRQFRRLVGASPHQYLIALRLRAAARRLEESDAPVTEIALDAGFNDISHFNQLFRRAYGMPPTGWRAQAKP